MKTLNKTAIPDGQIDNLEAFATATEPELRDVLLAVARCLREGDYLVAFDENTTLTPSQAADRLGMSRTHLYKLLDRGELPYDRVGRDRRIRVADLFAFEAKRQSSRRELAERFAHQQQTREDVIDELSDLL